MKSIGNYCKDSTEKHDSNASSFNLNRVPDRSQKDVNTIFKKNMVLFSPKGTSLKLFAIELSYIMEFQNTHASNLGLNIGPDSSPEVSPANRLIC